MLQRWTDHAPAARSSTSYSILHACWRDHSTIRTVTQQIKQQMMLYPRPYYPRDRRAARSHAEASLRCGGCFLDQVLVPVLGLSQTRVHIPILCTLGYTMPASPAPMSFAYIFETCLQPVQPIYSIVPAVPTAARAVAGAGLTAMGTSTVWVGTNRR